MDLDQGNIFHNALSWYFTNDAAKLGTWGMETHHPRILRAGSSALRGGAVSGVPGPTVSSRQKDGVHFSCHPVHHQQNCQMSSTITVGGSLSTSNSTAIGRTTPKRTASDHDSPKFSGSRASQKSISRATRSRAFSSDAAAMSAWSRSSASGTQKTECLIAVRGCRGSRLASDPSGIGGAAPTPQQ